MTTKVPMKSGADQFKSPRGRALWGARLACGVLGLLSCGWQWTTAQSAPLSTERIIHESWTFRDGAPEQVVALAQAGDGFLWVGAPTGLFRFDGIRFQPFHSAFGDQLLSTYVFALFAPPSDGLWVGYAFGGFSFIQNGRVKNFDLNTGSVYGFAQDRDGVVWAATITGLWRFDRSGWQHITTEWNAPTGRVCQVRFDHDGTLWVLTDSLRPDVGKSLFYLPPETRQFRNAGDNLFIEGFTLNPDNMVLTTPKPEGSPRPDIPLRASLPAYPILSKDSEQILDRNSGVWSMLKTAMVVRRQVGSPLTEIIGRTSREDSTAYNIDQNRYAHLVDMEGSLWLGDAKGIHRFFYSPLIKQEFPKPELSQSFSLAPDEGGVVWISAGNGNGLAHLYRVANGKAELRGSMAASRVAYRALDKTLWFAGEGGLWHFSNGSLTRVDLPADVAANTRSFQTITQDPARGLWVSAQGAGQYLYANGKWIPFGGRHDLPNGVVIEFTDKLGRIWFGYTKGRLAVLGGDSVRKFGPSEGIGVGNVTAIYGRGREIWIGGEFGLQQFDGAKFHDIEAVQKEWLRGIAGIIETENGDLWLNGLEGVLHLSRVEVQKALQDPAYRVTGEHFGRHEGVPGVPQQVGPLLSAIEGTDGRLWFTGTDGVVWLDPSRASNKTTPPPVSIQSISADGKGYALGQALTLPAHTANIEISYAAVSLLNPEAIRFRYKLQETDKDWHEAGTANAATFRDLPPGSYHFIVSASDTNGLWSDANKKITEFTILPAFYQTGWFRSLCVVLFIAILGAAHLFRIQHLRHQFDRTLEARIGERTRIARDLHDTLLQSFQGLLLRFQAAASLLPARPAEARELLDDAVERASLSIAEGRDAIHGLRMSATEKNDLASAVEAIAQELATAQGNEATPYQVVVEGASRELHPLLRDEVYRLATEALRNAFRHASARSVEVEIRYDARYFRLRVRDDGKGIAPEVLRGDGREGHYGLHGMRERAEVAGGKLTIWTEMDHGTEIELVIPGTRAYAKTTSDS